MACLFILVSPARGLIAADRNLWRKCFKNKSGEPVYDVCDPRHGRARRAYCFFHSGFREISYLYVYLYYRPIGGYVCSHFARKAVSLIAQIVKTFMASSSRRLP